METPQVFYNKFAKSDYEVKDSLEAGIVLTGWEIKSIRHGSFNLKGSYAKIVRNELELMGAHIGPLKEGIPDDPYRPRKLLIHKQELLKLAHQAKEGGLTLLPLRAYFKKGKVKVEIALAKGRKKFDKREAIKKKDIQKRTQRRIT
jgi:SsrA-binding protein